MNTVTGRNNKVYSDMELGKTVKQVRAVRLTYHQEYCLRLLRDILVANSAESMVRGAAEDLIDSFGMSRNPID